MLVVLLASGAARVVDPATGEVLAAHAAAGGAPGARPEPEDAGHPAAQGGQASRNETKGPGVVAAVSPRGNVAAIGRGAAIELRAIDGWRLLKAAPTAHPGGVHGLAFSPGGGALASVGEDGRLRIWNVPELEVSREIEKAEPLYAVAFSPDGRRIAFGGRARTLHEWRLDGDGGERAIAEGQPYWITAAGYSPDGRTIAVGDESCDIWVFDVESRECLFHSKHHVECWLSTVAWSPGGETFVFGCRPNSRAGKPELYVPNLVAEARQCEDVRKAAEECAAREAELAAALGNAGSEARERLRALIARRARLAGAGAIEGGALENAERALVFGSMLSGPAAATAPESQVSALPALSLQLKTGDAGSAGAFLSAPAGPAAAPLDEAARRELEQLETEIANARAALLADGHVKDALAKLEQARRAYAEAEQKRVAELRRTFNLNQWEIRKK